MELIGDEEWHDLFDGVRGIVLEFGYSEWDEAIFEEFLGIDRGDLELVTAASSTVLFPDPIQCKHFLIKYLNRFILMHKFLTTQAYRSAIDEINSAIAPESADGSGPITDFVLDLSSIQGEDSEYVSISAIAAADDTLRQFDELVLQLENNIPPHMNQT